MRRVCPHRGSAWSQMRRNDSALYTNQVRQAVQCASGDQHNNSNHTELKPGSLRLRWDVPVSRKAPNLHQPSNSTTKRDPETHRESSKQREGSTIKTPRPRLLSKSCIFTVNIYVLFFNNNKTADKDCLKNYFSIFRNLSHTRSADVL